MAYKCKFKFCGLKTADDVRVAVECGADAIGFVFSESPRKIDPALAQELAMLAPSNVTTHAVFGPEKPSYIHEVMAACEFDIAQVTGPDDDAYWEELRDMSVLRVFRVKSEDTLDIIKKSKQVVFLLDAFVEGKAGGTGKTFDWNLALKANELGHVILAGGLTPQNVAQAIRDARPFMVDVSGGIESERGVKDHALMKEFAAAVKNVSGGIA